MPKERVLVTGAAGFIGSAFLRHLLEAEPSTEAVTFDALTYAGHLENLEGLPGAERHTFVRGDVAEPNDVERAFKEHAPTAVVHFAAETHVDRSHEDPLTFVRTNVLGTQVMLDAARRAGIRMVHVSTDEVYGSLPEPRRAAPDAPLRPTSPYAASKAASDLHALAAFQAHGQDVLVTRCTNNYGPRQTPEKLIPLMTLRALAGETLPVYGDGLHVRDWIHVDDHVAGVLLALRRGRAGAVYHFAGGESRTNLEVVRRIVAKTGASPTLLAQVKDRPAHDRRYALDDSATRKELAWRPHVAFEAGLEATVAWYAENRDWCLQTAGENLRAFLARNYAGR